KAILFGIKHKNVQMETISHTLMLKIIKTTVESIFLMFMLIIKKENFKQKI
ncbi:hypothetical protein A5869_001751, partial [Enterococcus cecorum]